MVIVRRALSLSRAVDVEGAVDDADDRTAATGAADIVHKHRQQ